MRLAPAHFAARPQHLRDWPCKNMWPVPRKMGSRIALSPRCAMPKAGGGDQDQARRRSSTRARRCPVDEAAKPHRLNTEGSTKAGRDDSRATRPGGRARRAEEGRREMVMPMWVTTEWERQRGEQAPAISRAWRGEVGLVSHCKAGLFEFESRAPGAPVAAWRGERRRFAAACTMRGDNGR